MIIPDRPNIHARLQSNVAMQLPLQRLHFAHSDLRGILFEETFAQGHRRGTSVV